MINNQKKQRRKKKKLNFLFHMIYVLHILFGSKLAKFVKIKLLLKFDIEISLICPTDENSFV